PFLHVAARAIIRWMLVLPDLWSQRAACFRMAGQAFLFEIFWRFFPAGFQVGIMAADATQPFPARSIAFAQSHRVVVLKQVRLRRRLAFGGNHQDCHSVVERSLRPEVSVILSGLQYT